MKIKVINVLCGGILVMFSYEKTPEDPGGITYPWTKIGRKGCLDYLAYPAATDAQISGGKGMDGVFHSDHRLCL